MTITDSNPDRKSRRYDRQLRLWAASGQAALEDARILLISASATSTSILKNLVLPGIGHFTILDHALVTPQDAGNNFFLDGPDSIGKSRAEEAVRLLAELNEDVQGKADTRHLTQLLADEEGAKEWLSGYMMVIVHNLEKETLQKLSHILWEDQSLPSLVVVRSAGFLAEFNIQFHQHAIIESHLESSPSLRIDNAFPALLDYSHSLDLENMDVTDHAHIPYVVLLVRALQEWKKTHHGLPPQTYAEKQLFKLQVAGMRRKFDEENVEEAESQVYRCWTSSTVPSDISLLFSDPRLDEPSSSLPPFFQLVKALKTFTERYNCLPLTSTLPDMKASTDEYVRLQKMYKERSAEEKRTVETIVKEQGGGNGIDEVSLDNFVRNSHRLRLLKGRKWGSLEEDGGKALVDALASSTRQASTHLGLSALESVLSKKGYSSLYHQLPQISIEELTTEARALLPPGTSLPDPEWDEVAGELARAPTADLPNTAALLGGLVAQEVIKIITKQYVPIDGYPYDVAVYHFHFMPGLKRKRATCTNKSDMESEDEMPDEQANSASSKPPTGEEIRAIKDAAELYRSSAFKLQIDALLPNVRPKPSRQPPLDRFLLALHAFFLALPSVPPQHPLEAARGLLKHGVAVPYSLPLPTEETNWKVAFEKPVDIVLVGSWASGVSVKAKDGNKFGVDVALEMPHSLFQEKDYLNARFFQKRAFYLATIAAAVLKSREFSVDVAYDSIADDPRLTTLVITPRPDGSRFDSTKLNAQVHIIPFVSTPCPIPLHRLSPSHSNIRIKSSSSSSSSSSLHPPPTPIYNTHLLQCFTPKRHLVAAFSVKQDSAAFADALCLLRVWANQRGYGEGGATRVCVRGFNKGKGAWWSALVQLLVRGEEPGSTASRAGVTRALGRGLSSYQMFRAGLDVLAKFSPERDAVFLKSEEGHCFAPEEYRTHHKAIFVDSISLINFFADVPRGSLEMLGHDARKTLEMLDDPTFKGDPFTDVFLKDQRELVTRFDLVMRINLSKAESRKKSPHSTLDYGSSFAALISSIDTILHQALGDRSRAITILHPSSTLRPITQAHPSTPGTIFIGILHDPAHAFRLVDHGPAADEPDAAVVDAFRELWGDKAELRRFKDGRILYSVGGFDAVLRMSPAVSRVYVDAGVPVGFKAAVEAFDGVVRALKDLGDELPLALVQVSAVSEMLRYTSVFAPVAVSDGVAGCLPASARYMPVMEVVLQFERSGRWPDELGAIQRMKLAFFERIATGLMARVEGTRAGVVLGDGASGEESEVVDRAWLEIVTREGWAFAVRIWHEREALLLDRVLDANAKARKMPHVVVRKDEGENRNSKEYREALEAKETYLRRFVHSPRHHRAIAALCHRHGAYAGTVRLVKRWLAAHWVLCGHVSEEVVEVICASFFMGAQRARVPGSKERGFAAVIEFLKEWRWEEGLHVPLYEGEEGDVSSELSSKYVGSGVWRVTTEMDGDGRVWTARGPDVVVANRIKALARAAWECLRGMETGVFDVQTLFVHPTDDYDFIIKLDRTLVPRYFQNVIADAGVLSRRGKYANLASAQDPVRPGFDPIQLFFKDLQRIYADTFMVFYDVYGGDEMGCVWEPSVRRARPFRVLGGFSCAPAPDKGKKGMVELNESGVLGEIERLGAGLVKAIVVGVDDV
ncbi:hypothetical protein APHAL10511_005162 [Amanita phalloides]|nr:hypothetical protein APHAL10511_005162 [Amanita phalloides]